MRTASITGHRPQSLDHDFTYQSDIWEWIAQQLRYAYGFLGVETVVSGMALGVDQLAAQVATTDGIPFVAAVPFMGQSDFWPPDAVEQYKVLLGHASSIVVVTEGGYASWKMQKRNEWMADRAMFLIAVWNGTPGGTANCVKYARRIGIPIWWIDPSDRTVQLEWESSDGESLTWAPGGEVTLGSFIDEAISKGQGTLF